MTTHRRAVPPQWLPCADSQGLLPSPRKGRCSAPVAMLARAGAGGKTAEEARAISPYCAAQPQSR